MQTLTEVTTNPGRAVKNCIHCGQRVPSSLKSEFCCGGCETVYGLLQERGLGRFYDLRSKHGEGRKIPVDLDRTEKFAYLDDPEFISTYADASGRSMRFYLEGVHCAACVWLTENVPTLVPGVARVQLNLSSAVASVDLLPGGSFSAVAREFLKLGYRPHPVDASEEQTHQKKESRKHLLQLGVAAACSGNIMLLAIAIYAGASGSFVSVFRWVSFALFLPVLFYSAQPFFVAAWNGLKNRKISIDLPIAFGITAGTTASLISLFWGVGETYFDSLSGLIFLLLASRYLLRRVQAKAMNATHLLHFLTPSRAKLRGRDGIVREVKSESLKAGDEIEVLPGEVIPADGVLIEGSSHISRSWLTGETDAVRVRAGGEVSAGSLNESSTIWIRVTVSGAATRLAEILSQTETALRSRSSTMILADRMAEYFVPLTLVLVCVGFGVGAMTSLHEGFVRAMAVAIVVCPCALAMAIPLSMSLAIGKLAKKGFLVRGADVLEKLSKAQTLYFDKTGTLTSGKIKLLTWKAEQTGLEGILLGLESKSNHPIARAIREYFSSFEAAPIEGLAETIGRGVDGTFGGKSYSIRGQANDEGTTQVALFQDNKRVAVLSFGDPVRSGAADAVRWLSQLGFRIGILSGDQASPVQALASRVGIDSTHAFSQLLPEHKSEILKNTPGAVMVGDGVNDAIALAQASVGIAVQGGVEASVKAAGIYSVSGNPVDIVRLIEISRETMRVIHRNLAFTIFYNVVVVSVALSGRLNPLFAAVVMPLSAFTVFCLSIAGTRKQRRTLKEIGQ